MYEILPNYLSRNGVDVFWRTTNWGEPKVTIDHYLKRPDLEELCQGDGCAYDEVLISGLKAQLLASRKEKILLVLHTSTSHGPTYFKKYPRHFNEFTPVCKSVELGKCTQEELINAYDNTILYTDYILASLIEQLKELDGYSSSMFYVSDHGEILGEDGRWLHAQESEVSKNPAMITWYSDELLAAYPESVKALKENQHKRVTTDFFYHSVIDLYKIENFNYNKNQSIFRKGNF